MTHTWVHDDDTIVTLTIDGEIIETTPWHPFYTDEGWEDAGDLEVGDQILSLDGDYGLIAAVLVEDRTETMYDLTVDEVHTFAVGDGEWVVHNTTPTICTVFRSTDQNSDIVYRNPHHTELPTVETRGFHPKDSTATVKPAAHVYGPVSETQYVSFSRNIIWSMYYQGVGYQKYGVQNPLYVVDLNLANGRIIDLTDPVVFNRELRHPTARHWAMRAGEVLVEGHVPVNGIIARIDYDAQLVADATAIVERGLKEGWWSKGGSWYVK